MLLSAYVPISLLKHNTIPEQMCLKLTKKQGPDYLSGPLLYLL